MRVLLALLLLRSAAAKKKSRPSTSTPVVYRSSTFAYLGDTTCTTLSATTVSEFSRRDWPACLSEDVTWAAGVADPTRHRKIAASCEGPKVDQKDRASSASTVVLLIKHCTYSGCNKDDCDAIVSRLTAASTEYDKFRAGECAVLTTTPDGGSATTASYRLDRSYAEDGNDPWHENPCVKGDGDAAPPALTFRDFSFAVFVLSFSSYLML